MHFFHFLSSHSSSECHVKFYDFLQRCSLSPDLVGSLGRGLSSKSALDLALHSTHRMESPSLAAVQ